ncbi:MAG TPA: Xaa-Pro peptidase family protein [Paraburkholderia sp.]
MNRGIGGSTAESELAQLHDMTAGTEPIQPDEYRARIANAQRLMREQGMAALFVESNSNLLYFTGVPWRRSERMTGAIIPAQGEIEYIVPAFERGTFEGMLQIPGRMNLWQEHEAPALLIAEVLARHGASAGVLGFDETAPFFMYSGLRAHAPDLAIVSAAGVTSECRMRKSSAEIALMQRANDMTLRVHQAAARILREGITTAEVLEFIDKAHRKVGSRRGSTFCIVLFGADTAFPHGVKSPKALERGEMVLIDTGCELYGYQSDITRTYVFGDATEQQREVWMHEQQAQLRAFEAAQLGAAAEQIDGAARAYIENAGYQANYGLPGLPHRTGHGIGLDIHESPYMVKGNRTPLDTGMCFSIEPMICVPNAFGIRHEDHAYMTESGPRWFTQPASSIDDPFGVA